MSPDMGMAVGVGLTILTVLVVPALVLVYGAWRVAKAYGWPRWVAFVVAPVGLALGVALTFFVVFDDLGEQFVARYAGPTIEIQVTPGYRGTVVVFFAGGEPAPQAIGDNRYRIEVPKSGLLLTGPLPDQQRFSSRPKFELSYPDGMRPRLTTPSSSSGVIDGVSFARFFIGSAEDYRDDYEARLARGKLLDERDILKQLRAQQHAARKP